MREAYGPHRVPCASRPLRGASGPAPAGARPGARTAWPWRAGLALAWEGMQKHGAGGLQPSAEMCCWEVFSYIDQNYEPKYSRSSFSGMARSEVRGH